MLFKLRLIEKFPAWFIHENVKASHSNDKNVIFLDEPEYTGTNDKKEMQELSLQLMLSRNRYAEPIEGTKQRKKNPS